PYAPQFFHRVSIRTTDGRQKGPRFPREATYVYQLRAFSGAVLRGEPIKTGSADAIANMRVIDAAYEAAGLERRQPTA
ncbi:MAG: hypothetical protein QOC92_2452, partial [Acidimicrobiaceae bacterium]